MRSDELASSCAQRASDSFPLTRHIFEKNSKAPVYLVALPATTRRDLNKFLDGNNPQSTGALVIHRDGHISHEI